MTVGLGVVGSTYSFASGYGPLDATPLAQLMSEPEGILVPADSPFETVEDFVEAWKADPDSLAIGGGSSPGGPDHLFPMQLADEVGIDPQDVNYVSYDGGGPLTSALLGSKIDAGFSGPAEFLGSVENGELRMLAVSGEERSPQDAFADVPTLTESDIDLVFLNWRGLLAPAGHLRRAPRRAHRLPRDHARHRGVAGHAHRERLDRRLQDRGRVRDVPARSRTPGSPATLDGSGAPLMADTETPRTEPVQVDRGAVRPRRRPRPGRALDDHRRPRPQRRLRRPRRPPRLPLRRRRVDARARGPARGGHRPRRRRRGRGGRGHRPHQSARLAHRRQAGRDPRPQHAAGQRARLGGHRGPALRRLRLGARLAHPAPRPGRGRRAGGGAPGTSSTSASTCRCSPGILDGVL